LTRNTFILFLCILFNVSGCMQSTKTVTREPERYPQVESPPLLHIVKSPRETLGLIAEWYTGNFSNWTAIANYNGKAGSSIVRLGEKIFIPQELLVREDALELQPQIKQQESKKISGSPLTSPREASPVPITSIDASNATRPGDSAEVTPPSKKSIDELDLDELSEMVDLFDDEEVSSSESVTDKNEERVEVDKVEVELSEDSVTEDSDVAVRGSEQLDVEPVDGVMTLEENQEQEGMPPTHQNKKDSNTSLEIDEVEKRRIELLHELLRK
jgi:hypothetical protein